MDSSRAGTRPFGATRPNRPFPDDPSGSVWDEWVRLVFRCTSESWYTRDL